MTEKLGIRTYIAILLIGEIITASACILSGFNTKDIVIMVAAYFGIVTLFFFVSVTSDRVKKS